MRLTQIGAAAVLLIVASSGSSRANLVLNGDFGTGDFTDWTLATTSNGTLGPSPLPAVSSFNVTGSGTTNAAQFQVGLVTLIPPIQPQGGSISQTVTTGAGSFIFSAAIAAFASGGPNSEAGVFSVLLDGTTLDSIDVGGINSGQTLRNTLSFTDVVTSGPHDLEILVTRPFTNGNALGTTPFEYITDVTLTAVPEPASLTLLGTGLLGFGLIRRRRLPIGR
jgi:hypothetical protein